jgi:DNA topoisomerase IA
VFKLSGNKLLEEGFSGIATWLGVKSDSFEINNFRDRDNRVTVTELDYRAGQTQPPDFLTESELISLME